MNVLVLFALLSVLGFVQVTHGGEKICDISKAPPKCEGQRFRKITWQFSEKNGCRKNPTQPCNVKHYFKTKIGCQKTCKQKNETANQTTPLIKPIIKEKIPNIKPIAKAILPKIKPITKDLIPKMKPILKPTIIKLSTMMPGGKVCDISKAPPKCNGQRFRKFTWQFSEKNGCSKKPTQPCNVKHYFKTKIECQKTCKQKNETSNQTTPLIKPIIKEKIPNIKPIAKAILPKIKPITKDLISKMKPILKPTIIKLSKMMPGGKVCDISKAPPKCKGQRFRKFTWQFSEKNGCSKKPTQPCNVKHYFKTKIECQKTCKQKNETANQTTPLIKPIIKEKIPNIKPIAKAILPKIKPITKDLIPKMKPILKPTVIKLSKMMPGGKVCDISKAPPKCKGQRFRKFTWQFSEKNGCSKKPTQPCNVKHYFKTKIECQKTCKQKNETANQTTPLIKPIIKEKIPNIKPIAKAILPKIKPITKDLIPKMKPILKPTIIKLSTMMPGGKVCDISKAPPKCNGQRFRKFTWQFSEKNGCSKKPTQPCNVKHYFKTKIECQKTCKQKNETSNQTTPLIKPIIKEKIPNIKPIAKAILPKIKPITKDLIPKMKPILKPTIIKLSKMMPGGKVCDISKAPPKCKGQRFRKFTWQFSEKNGCSKKPTQSCNVKHYFKTKIECQKTCKQKNETANQTTPLIKPIIKEKIPNIKPIAKAILPKIKPITKDLIPKMKPILKPTIIKLSKMMPGGKVCDISKAPPKCKGQRFRKFTWQFSEKNGCSKKPTQSCNVKHYFKTKIECQKTCKQKNETANQTTPLIKPIIKEKIPNIKPIAKAILPKIKPITKDLIPKMKPILKPTIIKLSKMMPGGKVCDISKAPPKCKGQRFRKFTWQFSEKNGCSKKPTQSCNVKHYFKTKIECQKTCKQKNETANQTTPLIKPIIKEKIPNIKPIAKAILPKIKPITKDLIPKMKPILKPTIIKLSKMMPGGKVCDISKAPPKCKGQRFRKFTWQFSEKNGCSKKPTQSCNVKHYFKTKIECQKTCKQKNETANQTTPLIKPIIKEKIPNIKPIAKAILPKIKPITKDLIPKMKPILKPTIIKLSKMMPGGKVCDISKAPPKCKGQRFRKFTWQFSEKNGCSKKPTQSCNVKHYFKTKIECQKTCKQKNETANQTTPLIKPIIKEKIPNIKPIAKAILPKIKPITKDLIPKMKPILKPTIIKLSKMMPGGKVCDISKAPPKCKGQRFRKFTWQFSEKNGCSKKPTQSCNVKHYFKTKIECQKTCKQKNETSNQTTPLIKPIIKEKIPNIKPIAKAILPKIKPITKDLIPKMKPILKPTIIKLSKMMPGGKVCDISKAPPKCKGQRFRKFTWQFSEKNGCSKKPTQSCNVKHYFKTKIECQKTCKQKNETANQTTPLIKPIIKEKIPNIKPIAKAILPKIKPITKDLIPKMKPILKPTIIKLSKMMPGGKVCDISKAPPKCKGQRFRKFTWQFSEKNGCSKKPTQSCNVKHYFKTKIECQKTCKQKNETANQTTPLIKPIIKEKIPNIKPIAKAILPKIKPITKDLIPKMKPILKPTIIKLSKMMPGGKVCDISKAPPKCKGQRFRKFTWQFSEKNGCSKKPTQSCNVKHYFKTKIECQKTCKQKNETANQTTPLIKPIIKEKIPNIKPIAKAILPKIKPITKDLIPKMKPILKPTIIKLSKMMPGGKVCDISKAPPKCKGQRFRKFTWQFSEKNGCSKKPTQSCNVKHYFKTKIECQKTCKQKNETANQTTPLIKPIIKEKIPNIKPIAKAILPKIKPITKDLIPKMKPILKPTIIKLSKMMPGGKVCDISKAPPKCKGQRFRKFTWQFSEKNGCSKKPTQSCNVKHYFKTKIECQKTCKQKNETANQTTPLIKPIIKEKIPNIKPIAKAILPKIKPITKDLIPKMKPILKPTIIKLSKMMPGGKVCDISKAPPKCKGQRFRKFTWQFSEKNGCSKKPTQSCNVKHYFKTKIECQKTCKQKNETANQTTPLIKPIIKEKIPNIKPIAKAILPKIKPITKDLIPKMKPILKPTIIKLSKMMPGGKVCDISKAPPKCKGQRFRKFTWQFSEKNGCSKKPTQSCNVKHYFKTKIECQKTCKQKNETANQTTPLIKPIIKEKIPNIKPIAKAILPKIKPITKDLIPKMKPILKPTIIKLSKMMPGGKVCDISKAPPKCKGQRFRKFTWQFSEKNGCSKKPTQPCNVKHFFKTKIECRKSCKQKIGTTKQKTPTIKSVTEPTTSIPKLMPKPTTPEHTYITPEKKCFMKSRRCPTESANMTSWRYKEKGGCKEHYTKPCNMYRYFDSEQECKRVCMTDQAITPVMPTPKNSTSEESASDESASDESASDESASDESASDESASDESSTDEDAENRGKQFRSLLKNLVLQKQKVEADSDQQNHEQEIFQRVLKKYILKAMPHYLKAQEYLMKNKGLIQRLARFRQSRDQPQKPNRDQSQFKNIVDYGTAWKPSGRQHKPYWYQYLFRNTANYDKNMINHHKGSEWKQHNQPGKPYWRQPQFQNTVNYDKSMTHHHEGSEWRLPKYNIDRFKKGQNWRRVFHGDEMKNSEAIVPKWLRYFR